MRTLDDRGLAVLFDEAVRAYAVLDARYTGEAHAECMRLLEECQRRTEALALFSWNETAEDLQTASLKYLLLEYYLGRTHSLAQNADTDARLEALQEAAKHLEQYLGRLKSYELLDGDTLRLVRPVDAASVVREVKIARMKTVISLRQQSEESSVLLLDAEEAQRERHTALLRMHAIEATAELESIAAEVALLRLRSDGAADSRQPAPPTVPRSRPAVAAITQPFVLVRDRQQLAKDVFRPGHSLPTMTIDEYLRLERERGGILPRQSSTGAGEGEEDEDRDEVVDARTMRDRQFDLFKDDNPRGWGNSYNRG